MRYDPCTPVHYVINPALAPVNGVDDLQEAVRRVSSITGITLVFDGFTDEIPESRRGLDPNSARLPQWWQYAPPLGRDKRFRQGGCMRGTGVLQAVRTVVLAAATLSAPSTWSGATGEGMARKAM